jgi:hypothetical protein
MSIVIGMVSLGAKNGNNNPPVYAWIGCDGTAVTRTEVGKIEMTRITKNLPNCNGPKNSTIASSETDTIVTSNEKWLNMFEDADMPKNQNKIILDLSQKDIVAYRVEKIKEEQIKYANAIRSVRIRQGKSLESNTKGYLIKNDAVKVTGKTTGWTPVKSGEVVVTDVRENTVSIDTSNGTTGFVGTKFLRNATPSDLVKIGQADIAYWTDLVHTNVAHLVNIRNNPWYTAPIVTTVSSNVNLYRVATVDNWSQVQSIDGSINGFIRSDFLGLDKTQLIEIKPLLK